MGRACMFPYVSPRGLVTLNVARSRTLSKYQCNPCTSLVIVTLEQLLGVLRIIPVQAALYSRWQEQWAEPVWFSTFPLWDWSQMLQANAIHSYL